MKRLFPVLALSFWAATTLFAAPQIQPAPDAPQPLSPEDSARRMKPPPGFRIELVASEPLIREPSGVCWDEHGRLYVSELHGYNLEGHFDVQELNKTGQLDHEVRRIQANPNAKKAAEAGTYGTVKRLTDTNSDGRMDHAEIFADRLPPCYGLCPANGGVLVACAPDIVFLADRDGDGRAEVRETLFTGFATGALERGINAPQWGLDHWIYFGRGHGGAITGPRLPQPVRLGGTDFRIKPDGSAIEPITGATHTFGFAFTDAGERFVISTSIPGIFVTPLPWHYLARNPDAPAPKTEQNAADYTRVFPTAPVHPWRVKRAQDPGFFKFYRDRYGASDSDPGGFFTSACSPLVYLDSAFPSEFHNAYFVCEPAQNLIHRAVMEYDGPALRLHRAPGEETSEFLASSDPWFHPMNLALGPEGAVYIVDFYREIIEDYSAIPRYLQQQYGLIQGQDYGRLWRLSHQNAPPPISPDMSALDAEGLAREVASPRFWRRQTARRLLVERHATNALPTLARIAREAPTPAQALNALYTLEALGLLQPDHALYALRHPQLAVRRHGLRFAEPWLDSYPPLLNLALSQTQSNDPALLIQLALTLGESRDPRALIALTHLARVHGRMKWMSDALLSSLHTRAGTMLQSFLDPEASLGQAAGLLEPLCATVGTRRNPNELAQALLVTSKLSDPVLQTSCLRGFKAGLKNARATNLNADGSAALRSLLASASDGVRQLASEIAPAFQSQDPAQLAALATQAALTAADLKQTSQSRLAAVAQLNDLNAPQIPAALLKAWPANTPQVQAAILDALFSRKSRWPDLLRALEENLIPAGALTAFQRVTLLESDQPELQRRASKILARAKGADPDTFRRFASALQNPRNPARGETVFRDHCATCHTAHGLGIAVGPDLGAEFQRAEEAILGDLLAPSDVITAGYAATAIETTEGQTLSGILASESPTSFTLRMPAGLEQTVLRKDIAKISTQPVSLMPEALRETLSPQDAADVIAWLHTAGGPKPVMTNSLVLFEDEPAFLAALTEGPGQAALEKQGAFSGTRWLSVTPLQRHSPRIAGWNYRIREKPGSGEYRFLRLAWKTVGGQGVMLELAADGKWPPAKEPLRRYVAGRNTSAWEAREVSPRAPTEWTRVTLDLWKDNGAFTLTGLAPTALGGVAGFDRIELLRDLSTP